MWGAMEVRINTNKNVTINGLPQPYPLVKWIKVTEKLTERPGEIDKYVVISDFHPNVEEECDTSRKDIHEGEMEVENYCTTCMWWNELNKSH